MKKASPTWDVPAMLVFWIIGLFFYPKSYASPFLASYESVIQTNWLTWFVARAAWFLLWFVGYRLSAILASWIALSVNKTRNPSFIMPLLQGTSGMYYRRYKIYTFLMVLFIPLYIFLSFYGFGIWWGAEGTLDTITTFMCLGLLYITYYISSRAARILQQVEAYMGMQKESEEFEAWVRGERGGTIIHSASNILVILLSVAITLAMMFVSYYSFANFAIVIPVLFVIGMPILLFAGLFWWTFGPLFLPERAKLEDLRTAGLFTYIFDAIYLVSFIVEPVRNVIDRLGTIANLIIPVILILLTVLAIKNDRQRGAGGIIDFASWMLYVGIVGLSLSIFPKPLGSGIFENRELSSWYLLQVMVFMGALAPKIWLESALLTNRIGFSHIPVILKMIWKTKRGSLIFIASIILSCTTIYYVWRYKDEFLPPYALPFTLSIILTNIFLIFRPPIAIVLTGSKSWQLMDDVSAALFPHRTIAMLDEKKFIGAMFLNKSDNLRAMSFADWKSMVHRLVEITAVVIVDTRIPGESLKYETGLMLDEQRVHKAIFVVGFQGESPSLDVNRDKIGDSNLLKITEHELPNILHRFLRTGDLQKARGLK